MSGLQHALQWYTTILGELLDAHVIDMLVILLCRDIDIHVCLLYIKSRQFFNIVVNVLLLIGILIVPVALRLIA